MHRSSIHFDEKELDKLVLSEFTRMEKKMTRGRMQPREKTEKEFDPGLQTDTEISGEETLLLKEEEERFVNNAVDWLRPRGNKDAIVSKIWSMLTDSEPGSFYTPEPQQGSNRPEPSKSSDADGKLDAGQDRQD